MEDAMILDLYRARSASAIAETEKKYGFYCYAIAKNILHLHEDAEECVNDTYLKAWDSIPPQRPTVFSAYLGKITRNLSLNKYKQRRAAKRGGGELPLIYDELEECIPSKSSPSSEYEGTLVTEAINSCLLALDDQSRTVFVRRYWYADSISTIAQTFRMSESKVKSMLMRTRRTLKNHLEMQGAVI